MCTPKALAIPAQGMRLSKRPDGGSEEGVHEVEEEDMDEPAPEISPPHLKRGKHTQLGAALSSMEDAGMTSDDALCSPV